MSATQKRKRLTLKTRARKKITRLIDFTFQIVVVMAVLGLTAGPAGVKVLSLIVLLWVGFNLTLNLRPGRAR